MTKEGAGIWTEGKNYCLGDGQGLVPAKNMVAGNQGRVHEAAFPHPNHFQQSPVSEDSGVLHRAIPSAGSLGIAELNRSRVSRRVRDGANLSSIGPLPPCARQPCRGAAGFRELPAFGKIVVWRTDFGLS